MTTEKQIQANRSNAKHSTGPRTTEGKAASSQNALKHGLLARDAVLPGEDPADFEAQLAALEADLQPGDSLEFELVRQIADAQWRMRRLVRLETGYLAASLDNARAIAELGHPERLRPGYQSETLLLGFSMFHGTQSLVHLARYDGHLSRRFFTALRQLTELRNAREKRGAAPADHPSPVPDPPIHTSHKNNGTNPIPSNHNKINGIPHAKNPFQKSEQRPCQRPNAGKTAARPLAADSTNFRRMFCQKQGIGWLAQPVNASSRLRRAVP